MESVLRERLHALELTDASRLSRGAVRPAAGEGERVRSRLARRRRAGRPGLPLASKIHVSDPAVAGALADWLAGVVAVEGTPDARMREALRAGQP